LNTTLRKDIGAFSTYMGSLAALNHRNATAAELMVTAGVSYTAQNAVSLGVVDGLAQGATLQAELSSLGVPASTPIHTIDARSTFISILSDPTLASLLFLVGIAAILIDLYHPTFILTFVGAVLMVLAIYGLGSIGTSILALLLMGISAAFILLEVKTHHGLFATAGIVIFAVGFFLVFQSPPPSAPGSLPSGNFYQFGAEQIGLVSAIGAVVVIGSILLYKYREKIFGGTPLLSTKNLIGKIGTAETQVIPGKRGVAEVASEEWSVMSEQEIEPGEKVKVIGVDGMTLKVERVNT
jgi:membrane-bound serine protease (ClpP class)